MNGFILTLALVGQQCGPNGCLPERVPTSRVVGPVVRTAAVADPGYTSVVVRIENRQPDSIRYGSGVILTETGLVLTCRHIFRGGVGQLVVRRADGQAWNARFVAVDPINDLGAVTIGPVSGIPRVRYLREAPTEAVIVGFPGSRLMMTARLGRYQETSNVFYNVNSPFGVSGGPCFQPGTLALGGVQWGADGRSSAVTPITAVREFLGRIGRAFFGRRQPSINVTQVSSGPMEAVPITAFEPEVQRVQFQPVLPQVNPAPGLYDQVPVQLPAMPVVPKQLPTIDGPGKIMPTPQGPIGSFGPPASDPGIIARIAAIEAFINRPITFIDAGGRAFQAYLGDTLRVKIPAVNPDLVIEGMHGARAVPVPVQ